jgi:hypothetical protein
LKFSAASANTNIANTKNKGKRLTPSPKDRHGDHPKDNHQERARQVNDQQQ